MKSLNTTSCVVNSIVAFASIIFMSYSFGQDNFALDELNQKIANNNDKIESLQKDMTIIETIESNVLSSSSLDETLIKEEVKNLKSYEMKDALEISKCLDVINDEMVKAGAKFTDIVDRFDLASEGSIDLRFTLVNTAENLRDIYTSPYWIYDGGGDYGIPNINEKRFNEYKASLSVEDLKKKHDEIMKSISEPIITKKKESKEKLSTLQKENQTNKKTLISLRDQLETKDASDKNVMKWGFPIFIIFILSIYLVPLWYVYKRENLDGERTENLYRMIYGSGLVTEIITVFLLTSTILLLGITDKLDPEILGTLIGGISGYVLGRSFNNAEAMKNMNNVNNNQNK